MPTHSFTSVLVGRHRDPFVISQDHAQLIGDIYLKIPEDEALYFLPGVWFNAQLDYMRLIPFF